MNGGAQLDRQEFDSLRKLIREVTGISLQDNKQNLVAGRLAPRLRQLGLSSYQDYLRLVLADRNGPELGELVNAITTNKTSFFREKHHFDLLKTKIIPAIVARAQAGGPRRLRIWSAACSTGQEPWSIAMTVAEALGSLAGWDIRILASDLDTNVLKRAETAVYDEIATDEVPVALRQRFFEPAGNDTHRLVAPLRSLVTFRQMNLIAPATWNIRTRFDVIFCRNVAIYFDRPTQEVLFRGLAALLEPSGYLLSGHSENLHWLSDVLRPVGNTAHVLAGGASVRAVSAPASPPVIESGVLPVTRPRVAAPPPRAARPLGPPKTPPLQERQREEVAIQVGGIHASATGAVVKTTLGSCIAVCLFDPESQIGGMNHFLLPEDRTQNRGLANFGVHAMEMLINAMMKLGADKRRFVAKIFGGAEQFGGKGSVGRSNADFTTRFLEDEGIPLVAQKVGGRNALAIQFDTADGRVLVKTIESTIDVDRAEKKHLAALAAKQTQKLDCDITFFGAP